MTFRRRLVPACLGSACSAFLLLAAPAQAQMPRVVLESGARQEGWVRIQNTISYFVAGPAGEGEEAQKLRDRARRTIYDIASRECDILREILAKECRIESVSINTNRQQYGQQQPEGFTVTGSMNFQITLK